MTPSPEKCPLCNQADDSGKGSVCSHGFHAPEKSVAQEAEALLEKLRAEEQRNDALLRLCESDLHKAPVGCPYCQRDERVRDLVRDAADALHRLEAENRSLREALRETLKALPDSTDGGPEGSGYKYVWDECTGAEQDFVKQVRDAALKALEDSSK